jgi:hypothetical protein
MIFAMRVNRRMRVASSTIASPRGQQKPLPILLLDPEDRLRSLHLNRRAERDLGTLLTFCQSDATC